MNKGKWGKVGIFQSSVRVDYLLKDWVYCLWCFWRGVFVFIILQAVG